MGLTITICLLIALLSIEVVIRIIYVRIVLSTFDIKPPFNVAQVLPDPAAERITFKTTLGLTLRGAVHRPPAGLPRGVILFCTELDGTHWLARHYCDGLIRAGFAVISFDFRSQGESDSLAGYEPNQWMTRYEIDDTISALEWIESHAEFSSLPLGVMGVSRGSTAALWVAARYPHVLVACCDGAYSLSMLAFHFVSRWASIYMPQWAESLIPDWHYRSTVAIVQFLSARRRKVQYVHIESYLKRLKSCPTLFIAGEKDNYVPYYLSQELMRRIRSPLAKVWIVPKAKHNKARHTEPGQYDQILVQHFEQMLPQIAEARLSNDESTHALKPHFADALRNADAKRRAM